MSERDFKGPASRCTPLRSVLDVEGDNLFVVQSRLEETTEVTLTETRFSGSRENSSKLIAASVF